MKTFSPTSIVPSSRRGRFAATKGVICAVSLLAAATPGFSATMIFTINADGFQEVSAAGVPNGDPNGFATGTVTLDNGTGSGLTGSAQINLTIGNIDGALSAHHFHVGPPTTTGPVRLDFGAPNNILTGTATAGTLIGTITGLDATRVNEVFANPTGFYYNLHSTPNFPGGAVRHQLVPEPTICGFLAIGLAGLCARRRRA